VLPSPRSAAAPQRYVDARHGFELLVPGGWRQGKSAPEGGGGDDPDVAAAGPGAGSGSLDAPPAGAQAGLAGLAADYDVAWEDPATGARLAVSAWEAGRVASFPLWSALVGAGMAPTAGEAPYNALVAGQPALLLWAPESAVSPARYALLFERGGRYFRLAYGAADGGAGLVDFGRAAASLRWPEDTPAAAVVPLSPPGAGRYWPGEAFIGR
jgi:hypothetical protein